MNSNKLILNYKNDSEVGTRLIPTDDVCSALSVETIGSYFAPEDYRKLYQSFDHSNQNKWSKLNSNLNEFTVFSSLTKDNLTKINELLEVIDDKQLPECLLKLREKKLLKKLIDQTLLKCENSELIINKILNEAKEDFCQSLKKSIIYYVLKNNNFLEKFNNKIANNLTLIEKSLSKQSFEEMKRFHQNFNYTTHPIILEILKVWDKKYRNVDVFNFDLSKALNINEFKSIITQNCQKVNYRLKLEWVSDCSQIVLNKCPNLINLDTIVNQTLFNTIATFMTRLLRQLVITNIEKWTQILTDRSTNSKPLFKISIKCRSLGTPYFIPLINSWKEFFTFPLYQILNSAKDIDRVENQLILMKSKDFYCKKLNYIEDNDSEFQNSLLKTLEILEKEISCQSIIERYEREFTSNLFEINNQFYKNYYEINELLEIVRKCKDRVKSIVSAPNHFKSGVFYIDFRHFKLYIKQINDNKINKMIGNKVYEIISLSHLICNNFLVIEQNMTKELNSISELIKQTKKFEEYKANINLMLLDIQYIENHWGFVIEEGAMIVNEADLETFHQLYNWPKRIKNCCDDNEKRFHSNKSEVENKLRQRVLILNNKLHDLLSILNTFRKKRLNSPIECISDNCKALDTIGIELNKCIEESNKINFDEKILEFKDLSKFPIISQIIELKTSLDSIWKTANQFHTREKEWMTKSMRALDIKEIRYSVDQLLSTSTEMTESFKSESIDLFQNANSLQTNINTFKKKYIPLLEVLSNPFLREKHWHKLSEILGQRMSFDLCKTLNDVISLTNAAKYITQIECLGSIAMKEHELEVFLERMKNEWIEEWPNDALEIAANKFLEGESLETELKEKCAKAFKYIHLDSLQFSYTRNKCNELSDVTLYVTPPLFLELILIFKSLLKNKQKLLSTQRNRYSIGIEKLCSAANHVESMQNKLIHEFQPLLVISSEETEKLMIKIERETIEVETKKEIIAADEAIANTSAAFAQQIKDECTKELSQAIPAIKSAITALNTLKSDDITFLRTMKNPPKGVKMVLEAVCILKGLQITTKANLKETSIYDTYWSPTLKMLSSDIKFLESLKSFDRNHIPRHSITFVRQNYLSSKHFDPISLRKVSIACEGLAKWVRAIDIYDRVINVVKPKKERLKYAEQELIGVLEKLENKKRELQKTCDLLQQFYDEFSAMSKKKKELEENIDFGQLKLERAEQLIKGLAIEEKRWKEASDLILSRSEHLVGDVLLSAAIITYTSSLNSQERELCVNKWQNYLIYECELPFSQPFSIIDTLGEANQIRIWTMAGLSAHQFDIENAIIAHNCKRYPFIVDPKQDINKWIQRLHPNLIRFDFLNLNEEYSKTLIFNAIKRGEVVLIENVCHKELNSFLTQLVEKEIIVKNGIQYIKFGKDLIEFSTDFWLYICAKNRLELSPKISAKINLINWCSDHRNNTNVNSNALLLQTKAEKEKQLIELEDQILHILSTAETNVLEDENAIKILIEYKNIAKQLTNVEQ